MSQFFTVSNIFMFLNDIVNIYLYNMMLKSLYEKKKWSKDRPLLFAIFITFDFSLLFGLNLLGIMLVNTFITIATYFILMYGAYEVKHLKGIYYFMFFMITVIVAESVTYVVSENCVPYSYVNEVINYENTITPVSMTGLTLCEIVIAVLICTFGKRDSDNKIVADTLIFAMIPLISIILFYIYVSAGMLYNESIYDDYAESVIRISIFIVVINFIIFVVLEKFSSIYKEKIVLAEEKVSLEAQSLRMESAANLMKERLEMTEEKVNSDRIMRHDRRHFEALLLNLLQQDKQEEAIMLLQERMEQEPRHIIHYCDNSTLNAAISHYDNVAKQNDIKTEISLNIPKKLEVDELNFAIAAGNLFENAINACNKISVEKRYIKITAQYKSQLLLEIENPCAEEVTFDEQGYPVTTALGHGVGTKSVVAFVNSTEGDIRYTLDNGIFKVRMIINV